MGHQDRSQKILLFVLITCLVFIVVLYINNKNEKFSPYRNTGGIYDSVSGFNYLDEYSDKDWYEMNPWIYPSDGYYQLLFKYQRENNKYLEEKRKLMLKNLGNVPY